MYPRYSSVHDDGQVALAGIISFITRVETSHTAQGIYEAGLLG